jgi:hypothetical protein
MAFPETSPAGIPLPDDEAHSSGFQIQSNWLKTL